MLAVHAHPDDESLTMGGTLAALAAAGHRVTLVTCTLGEQGEVIGDEVAGLVADEADQLGGYRLVELQRSAARLGLTEQVFLGRAGRFRDSGMAGTPSAGHPRAFLQALESGPFRDAAVAELRTVLDRVRPDVLLTYDADGGYGHPDHVAAHRVAMAAAAGGVPRVLAAVKPRAVFEAATAGLPEIAGYRAPGPDDLGFLLDDGLVDLAFTLPAEAVRARREALRAHATQVQVLTDDVFALSNRILQPLLPTEYFRVLAGPPLPADAHEPWAGL